MNVPFVAVMAGTVACRCPHAVAGPIEWYPLRTAWRALDHVLTWDTEDGARRFVDMNSGTVKPLSEVFDQSVILSPIENGGAQANEQSNQSDVHKGPVG
jgi:hypothetical protein